MVEPFSRGVSHARYKQLSFSPKSEAKNSPHEIEPPPRSRGAPNQRLGSTLLAFALRRVHMPRWDGHGWSMLLCAAAQSTRNMKMRNGLANLALKAMVPHAALQHYIPTYIIGSRTMCLRTHRLDAHYKVANGTTHTHTHTRKHRAEPTAVAHMLCCLVDLSRAGPNCSRPFADAPLVRDF